jgi:hypothetical protein
MYIARRVYLLWGPAALKLFVTPPPEHSHTLLLLSTGKRGLTDVVRFDIQHVPDLIQLARFF